MGASGWTFFVPYQPDIKKAFLELQQQVIDQQQFYPPRVDQDLLQEVLHIDSEETFERLRDENQLPWPLYEHFLDHEAFEKYRQKLLFHLEQFQNTPHIRNLEDLALHQLFAIDDFEGTHSPLDLHFADDPEPSPVIPLKTPDLLRYFGTTQPTRKQLDLFFEEEGFDLSQKDAPYHKWQAIYFLVYENGEPIQICFDGASGD